MNCVRKYKFVVKGLSLIQPNLIDTSTSLYGGSRALTKAVVPL
jgi:hypothetical protein